MAKLYPDAHCELYYTNPFELVIAVLLSAQTTDINVNRVTPELFKRFKTPEDILSVPVEEIENHIRSIGLYRTKAKNIQKLARKLIDDFNGEVPKTRAELESLAGVGRKTANVVLSVAFDIPAIAVDTHVERVAKRLAFCRWKDTTRQVKETLIKKIQKLARKLIDDFNGEVPKTRAELESLAGVGRKTANVVLSVAFDIPAIAVDTHVERVAKRLAFCRWKDNTRQVEETLMKKIPKEEWSVTHHRLIFFGRYHCTARNPECPTCELVDICREGKKVMKKINAK